MSRYITKTGYDAITAEIAHLWRVERPFVVNEVSEAADLGDRSENAAYIYGKKRLRHIDSRLRHLRGKIDGATVIDVSTMPQHSTVRFGAIVVVENEDGEEKTWRLVDKVESDPKKDRISIQSPIGQALSGRQVGDVVIVQLPNGQAELEIIGIRYGGGLP